MLPYNGCQFNHPLGILGRHPSQSPGGDCDLRRYPHTRPGTSKNAMVLLCFFCFIFLKNGGSFRKVDV